MNRKPATFTTGAASWLLIALTLTVGLLAATPAPARADNPAPSKATAKYEIDFMEGMIDHHFMAVQMPQICVGKAVHEELRGLCQNIITTQQQELAERVSSPE